VQAELDKIEDLEWEKGTKGKNKRDIKRTNDEEKKKTATAKKQEAQALLAAEEQSLGHLKPVKKPPKPIPVPRGSEKVALKRQEKFESSVVEFESCGSFGASNIDDALNLLENKSGNVDKHPERRVKAAYQKWQSIMMPKMKEENPTLRFTQLEELLLKKWQKAPENPFNQANINFNATKEEINDYIEKISKDTHDRLEI
jgi:hypothetical protein